MLYFIVNSHKSPTVVPGTEWDLSQSLLEGREGKTDKRKNRISSFS